jgi:hypothetical protein
MMATSTDLLIPINEQLEKSFGYIDYSRCIRIR